MEKQEGEDDARVFGAVELTKDSSTGPITHQPRSVLIAYGPSTPAGGSMSVVNMFTTPGFHQVPTVLSLTLLTNLPTDIVLPISHPFRNILFHHPIDLLSLSFPRLKVS